MTSEDTQRMNAVLSDPRILMSTDPDEIVRLAADRGVGMSRESAQNLIAIIAQCGPKNPEDAN